MPRKAKSAVATGGAMPETTTAEAQPASAPDTGRAGESMQGYFRRIFAENARLLKVRSNDEVFQLWLRDHPGYSEVPDNVKTAASNAKTLMRAKKKKRNKGAAAAAPGEEANGAPKPGPRPSSRVLQTLEEKIDQCLAVARNLDPQGLEEVIHSLRRARNEVIVKQGTV
jgi:hypothetical protein